jgi:hypothetical protein
MLSQQRADELIAMPKRCADLLPIKFPLPGETLRFDVESEGASESFILDVNRKGRIRLTKCTYQERYAVIEILLRLDVDGPPHENPDGVEVASPHLHVYREGYGDKWAQPAPPEFSDTGDLARTLQDFMRYCKIQEIPEIQYGVA